ncbi:MAG TPA: hypothetical protein VFQ35_18485, partial [Polyangiaceae bacterium]|nr:hypothetical protein [Polyangiaceae bacterium]
ALAALALPFALAAVSPFGASLASGAHSPRAVACYTFGAALSLPILLLVRLLDRNERSPLLPLALTAAATGLIANLVLSLHCASDDPVHLALGHASIGVGWLLAVVLRERFRSRSSASSR